jgi:hypothetical protein
MQHTGSHPGQASTTTPLLGEALISSAALKALLPAVPKIHPQLPTFNQSVHVNNTAEACNETAINANRTADMTRLKCNATANSTIPSNKVEGGLPGIGFFKNLQDMNNKFQADTKDNKNKSAATGSDSSAAQAAKKANTKAGPGEYGIGSTADMFEAFKQKQSRQGAAGGPKPPDQLQPAAKAAVQAVSKQRYTKPIGPQKPPGVASSSSKSA